MIFVTPWILPAFFQLTRSSLFVVLSFSTFIRAVYGNRDIWNSLPNFVVDVDCINTFKTHVDKFWQNQEVKFDFKVAFTKPEIALTLNM